MISRYSLAVCGSVSSVEECWKTRRARSGFELSAYDEGHPALSAGPAFVRAALSSLFLSLKNNFVLHLGPRIVCLPCVTSKGDGQMTSEVFNQLDTE